MLVAYLARRDGESETFRAFTARHSIEHLQALFDPEGI
jgi:hypothetical protein